MRKILVFLTLLCLLCGLALSANAATVAKNVNADITVSADSSCYVVLSVQIHLDEAAEDLCFPLPGNARDITVNGERAEYREEEGLLLVELSSVVKKLVGDFTFTFTYRVSNLVSTNKAGQQELELPLLSGFSYPVEQMDFSVTLPGQVETKPAFSSGYHQANIEKYLHYTQSGATIRGVSQMEMKDRETLKMTLIVPDDMFHEGRIEQLEYRTFGLIGFGLFLLAVLYWTLFLRNVPTWPRVQPAPPDGYSAGEMGSVLHLRGGDLNMMVFSWAQLGYLLIRLEKNGNATLHRQMDMGNERSSFEQRCFKLLFNKRNIVDVSSRRYGAVCRAVGKMKPNLSDLVHPRSGNLVLLRVLLAGTSLFCGITLGASLSDGAVMQWVLLILVGGLALLSGWYMQLWACSVFASRRQGLWLSLAMGAAWLTVSILAGRFGTGLGLVMSQLAGGLLLAVGGRRTLAGKYVVEQALGLYRYFKVAPREQLKQTCRNNPEFFHQMMPYAMALGVDKIFAKRLDSQAIAPCPYILLDGKKELNPWQWREVMRRILRKMNTR